ncbi:MAG: flagella basal body P-ring formation protein FlgA, partial [Verrucomicrobia bacterium]|nr:flagella basal body P-ring formation protein FlgA [Verrucomicrobiota bacterium]
GASGQVIRVRNPGSRREMRGKVINDQTVQIQM